MAENQNLEISQSLFELLEKKDEQISELQKQNSDLNLKLVEFESENEGLRLQVDLLKRRVNQNKIKKTEVSEPRSVLWEIHDWVERKEREEEHFKNTTAILAPYLECWEKLSHTPRPTSPASSDEEDEEIGWGHETPEEMANLRKRFHDQKNEEKRRFRFMNVCDSLEKAEEYFQRFVGIENPTRMEKLHAKHAKVEVEKLHREFQLVSLELKQQEQQ